MNKLQRFLLVVFSLASVAFYFKLLNIKPKKIYKPTECFIKKKNFKEKYMVVKYIKDQEYYVLTNDGTDFYYDFSNLNLEYYKVKKVDCTPMRIIEQNSYLNLKRLNLWQDFYQELKKNNLYTTNLTFSE